jgi:predicted DsbA family dithiol-disulfide isomerase
MKTRTLALAAVLGLAPVLVAAQAKDSSRPAPLPKAAPPGAAATVGDTVITGPELDELARPRLMSLRNQEYFIKRQILEERINRTLLEKEAAARKISVAELEKLEIEDAVAPVSDQEKRSAYEANPQQFQGRSEAEAFSDIEANLKRMRGFEARKKYMATLRAKGGVRILLEPPRFAIKAGDDPSKGPADAAVTIVEFSDFQCPACAQATPTVKRLLEQFPGKVRLVFRDFPLAMHPEAPKAAEAAGCAAEQGKFWEMHDRLFANQSALKPPDLKKHAAELGLDAPKFDACLDSGKQAAAQKVDLEEGRKLGVGGTPTFFVNGRLLPGMPPYQAFAELIEDELARNAPAR